MKVKKTLMLFGLRVPLQVSDMIMLVGTVTMVTVTLGHFIAIWDGVQKIAFYPSLYFLPLFICPFSLISFINPLSFYRHRMKPISQSVEAESGEGESEMERLKQVRIEN